MCDHLVPATLDEGERELLQSATSQLVPASGLDAVQGNPAVLAPVHGTDNIENDIWGQHSAAPHPGWLLWFCAGLSPPDDQAESAQLLSAAALQAAGSPAMQPMHALVDMTMDDAPEPLATCTLQEVPVRLDGGMAQGAASLSGVRGAAGVDNPKSRKKRRHIVTLTMRSCDLAVL